MRFGWKATGVALVLALAASGCGDDEPDDASLADATTGTTGQTGDGTTVTTGVGPPTTGTDPSLADGGAALCPTVDELNAAVGAATTERDVAETAEESAARVTCQYRQPGPGGSEVAWSIEVRRFGEGDDAAFSFGVARRTDISEETPLPGDVRLGDEAAYGRSVGDVLIVRRGADLVKIKGVARPASAVEDLIAVFELVAGVGG